MPAWDAATRRYVSMSSAAASSSRSWVLSRCRRRPGCTGRSGRVRCRYPPRPIDRPQSPDLEIWRVLLRCGKPRRYLDSQPLDSCCQLDRLEVQRQALGWLGVPAVHGQGGPILPGAVATTLERRLVGELSVVGYPGSEHRQVDVAPASTDYSPSVENLHVVPRFLRGNRRGGPRGADRRRHRTGCDSRLLLDETDHGPG